jgi:OmpA-OmpF porin, OOP family
MLYLAAAVLLMAGALAAQAQTAPARPEPAGSRDHPLVGRFEGSRIAAYRQSAFDSNRVIRGPVTQRNSLTEANSVQVDGRQTLIVYAGPDGRSPLEMIRNYQQSLGAHGFETVFECHRETCGDRTGNNLWFTLIYDKPLAANMNPSWDTGRFASLRLRRQEGDIHVMIYAQRAGSRLETRVEVVEAGAMEADRIRILGASELKAALDSTGRAALYGIYFDVDKAEVKPESKPQIDAILAFLRADPSINVIVAGHTDNQGAFDYNVALSQRRAQAVLRALSSQGVAPRRLTAFGNGMASPVAPNDTPDGQARNRRVEIVRR